MTTPTAVSATATPVATAAPAPAPATPAPAAAPMVATPDAMMANGGETSTGGGVKDFFKSLNWVEVGISALAVAALTYKMINNDLQRQIDELKMNMQSAMKGRYKTI